MADRYTLLGLARARSEWFRSVAQWATSAALPADFTKCVSAEELRTLLSSARPFSAALLDGGLPSVDRDLLAAAREAGTTPLVLSDGRDGRDWVALGAAAVLPIELRREVLLDALATHATMVGSGVGSVGAEAEGLVGAAVWEAPLVAVSGPGGTGASTVAMALAQGVAARADAPEGGVALVDLCRHAELAMLHDVGDVFPGVQELVEAHRGRALPPAEVRALTFTAPDRGYDLLLGLRRARYWSALRPRALDAAVHSLRRAYGLVVADVDADLEGEDDGGSLDVEERNGLSRTAVTQAALVLAVGAPGTKGLHALVRVIADLVAAGVGPDRILPVINSGPRQPRARSAIAAALGQLVRPVAGDALCSPLVLPRRRVEEALRDGAPLPQPLPALTASAVLGVLERSPVIDDIPSGGSPERILPGSLGHWGEEAAG